MEDARIVELYWERDEAAIAESSAKYGGYCYQMPLPVLGKSTKSTAFPWQTAL